MLRVLAVREAAQLFQVTAALQFGNSIGRVSQE